MIDVPVNLIRREIGLKQNKVMVTSLPDYAQIPPIQLQGVDRVI